MAHTCEVGHVPSHALGHTLGECLARDAINWTNLRMVTPLDLASSPVGADIACPN
jgi:hypothetical protein